MFPFWDTVIAPVLDAVQPQRVVEIGALRGETTQLVFSHLPDTAELHVIDPLPEFDPDEHASAFEGRYHFHRALSLDALPTVPACDVALIDGDHNWYTVLHELLALWETSRAAGKPLPVCLLHDVGWPYGRRDLYYDPDTIPAEHRQPFRQLGIRPGRDALLPEGGLNREMCNATTEGGPRNGVLTGVEDFLDRFDAPVRTVLLESYFGLFIVAEESVIAEHPQLGRLLDSLDSGELQPHLLQMAEDVRLKAALFQQNVFRHRNAALEVSARRYLDLLSSALLDELSIENSARLEHLLRLRVEGSPPTVASMAFPREMLSEIIRGINEHRRTGRQPARPAQPGVRRPISPLVTDDLPYCDLGRIRCDALISQLDVLRAENVPGDLVQVGVGRGGTAILLRGYLDAWHWEMKSQQVWVVDEFLAHGRASLASVPEDTTSEPLLPRSDLDEVRHAFERFGLYDDRVHLLAGALSEQLPQVAATKISVLSIGSEMANHIDDALEVLVPRLAVGGLVVVDDFADPAVADAVAAFRTRHAIEDRLEALADNTVSWRHSGVDAQAASVGVISARARDSPDEQTPLPRPLHAGVGRLDARADDVQDDAPMDLTVVVAFYNMAREAKRTLRSLSRSYQRDLGDLRYEVIAVENGSDPDQKLSAEFVESFGPEFRYLDYGAGARPSPVAALNDAIRMGRGDHFAVMIDGAHLLTPGVLHYGMRGLRAHPCAVVATQHWYLGPGEQNEMMAQGYDQEFEDRLLGGIAWPADGYELFSIGHFIGGRDWFDGFWESNCLFVPRVLLERYGLYDERFVSPGGGYANLELFDRHASAPEVTLVTVVGEASFHQIHGGTTTNVADRVEHRDVGTDFAAEYQSIVGKPYEPTRKTPELIGSLPAHAQRSRPRSNVAPHLFLTGPAIRESGFPSARTPISTDAVEAFTSAYWQSLQWRQTTWRGEPMYRSPADLVAYQELILSVRPAWIIQTSRGYNTFVSFLASIEWDGGAPQILLLHDAAVGDPPDHPRIHSLHLRANEPSVPKRVGEFVGDDDAFVFLSTRLRPARLQAEFDNLAPFVPIGGWVVVEETIVNGHPVWPEHGAGPYEFARKLAATRDDFAPEAPPGGCVPSFNPAGYFRRIR